MNRPLWIFVAVLALGLGIAALGLIDSAPGAGGRAHEEIPALRQGGDGGARHAPLLLPGWLLGCGIIFFLSVLVRFGAVRGAHRAALSRWMAGVTALYLGAWTWLVWAYRASLHRSAPELWWSLPRPTAIMIFVFWPVSMLFSALFVLGFRRWVLTDEEEAAFRRLVARRGAGDR